MDISIDDNRDLLIVDNDLILNDGRDRVIQELNIRLAYYLGEWFLDRNAGVPYFEVIFLKTTPIQTVNAVFLKEINDTENVNEILEFETSLNNDSREFILNFKVDTAFGIINFNEVITI